LTALQNKLGKFDMEPTPPADFTDHIGNKTIKIINSEYWGELDSKNMANGYGILISSGEDIYEGYFLNDKRHFRGRHLNKDGSYYEGEWEADREDGRGLFKNPKDGKEYAGEWCQGREQGRGKMIFPSGNTYKGKFYKGLRDGNGVFIWDKKVTKSKWNNADKARGDFSGLEVDSYKYDGGWHQD